MRWTAESIGEITIVDVYRPTRTVASHCCLDNASMLVDTIFFMRCVKLLNYTYDATYWAPSCVEDTPSRHRQ